MREPIWLDRAVLDRIQHNLVKTYGGDFGVRDSGLIDSALGRARNVWAYDPDCDFAALAAAYAFGLAKNHGYVDGNKRVAFVAMALFLAENGLYLDVPEAEAVIVMLEVACGERSEARLATWLREQFTARALTIKKRVLSVQEVPPRKTTNPAPRKKAPSRRAAR